MLKEDEIHVLNVDSSSIIFLKVKGKFDKQENFIFNIHFDKFEISYTTS